MWWEDPSADAAGCVLGRGPAVSCFVRGEGVGVEPGESRPGGVPKLLASDREDEIVSRTMELYVLESEDLNVWALVRASGAQAAKALYDAWCGEGDDAPPKSEKLTCRVLGADGPEGVIGYGWWV